MASQELHARQASSSGRAKNDSGAVVNESEGSRGSKGSARRFMPHRPRLFFMAHERIKISDVIHVEGSKCESNLPKFRDKHTRGSRHQQSARSSHGADLT